MNIKDLFIIFIIFFTTPHWALAEFEKEMKDVTGTFILMEGKTGKTWIHNEKRASEPYAPCSTFKIPNTLIALETKTISSPTEKVAWDSKKYPAKDNFLPEWNAPLNLKEAFQFSCVWFYKEIAEKVGAKKMQVFLKEFSYGNEDISGGITHFWIESSLKISAREQISFLKKLHERSFPLRASTYDVAENDVFCQEKTPTYSLYAKTGTGRQANGIYVNWYVGYVVRGDKTYYFAMNMDSLDMKNTLAIRKTITRTILKNKGIID